MYLRIFKTTLINKGNYLKTYKLIIQVEGIKKKQQAIKTHNILLANSVQFTSLNEFEDRARDMVASNMKTSNKAILKAYRTRVVDDSFEEVSQLPEAILKL